MSTDHRTRLRRLMVVCIYVLAAVWGLFSALRPDDGRLHLLLSAAIACAMTGWCVVDSRIRRRPVIRTFYFLIFITWPLAVPIYLIWSRKLRGLIRICIHGLALCGLCIGSSLAVDSYVYGLADRGYLALEREDYDRAASLLQSAVAWKGDEPDWWYNLGAAFERKGETAKAVEAFRQALHLDADDADCRRALFSTITFLAYEAQTQGNQHRAATLYREAIAIDDSDPTAWRNLGIVYHKLGDVSSAIDAVERARSLDSANHEYQGWLEMLRRMKESSKGRP